MDETTGIAWTDSTVNFWWGCTKVGPGCDDCYAESTDKRAGAAPPPDLFIREFPRALQ